MLNPHVDSGEISWHVEYRFKMDDVHAPMRTMVVVTSIAQGSVRDIAEIVAEREAMPVGSIYLFNLHVRAWV